MNAAAAPEPRAADAPPRRRRRRRWPWILLFVLLLAGVGGRLALEPGLRWYVNRTLDRDPGFDGRIDGISIALWRGAYRVEGVRLDKTAAGIREPLLTLDALDLSLQWGALLKGAVVGEVELVRPVVTFVDGGEGGESQSGAGGPWLGVLSDLLPFQINRVGVRDGTLRLRSERGAAPLEAEITALEATVSDLTNVDRSTEVLVTKLDATCRVMGSGEVELHGALDPFSWKPTFELRMRMLGLDVTEVNGLARVYGGLDFNAGRFDLTLEASAEQGLIEGTVQPLFRGLDVFSLSQDAADGDPLNAAYQALVGSVAELLENQERDQFGTRVAFEASSEGLGLNVLEVVGNVLYNAFVQAFLPELRAQSGGGFRFTPQPVAEAPAQR
ncbi:AsmA family protein [Phycisphaera mikurensis]|uniref:AsmA-like C-terminal domain-containing protein n=1 Tax=Phycisphaera mikurensis (strain NBRC 102666 / KCTC 22515 / FYK2301M01) TaxID=1142394 RepID=I0IBG2_PHYMF|nr:DUF748 domain-containing protein [Phycisphaera mikurensis]MBB6442867.1 hypothetical protein [Phycisphaera mikurensis]BAM02600.1 hypothetical protein PSMK_04410 [Phycisphaera mikurensis NBRC 102666]